MYICIVTPTTPLSNHAHFGGYFISKRMRYTSTALSIDGMLELLDSKGLTIDCKTTAVNCLSLIGFFRLRQYMQHFYVVDNKGEYAFKQDACFKDIINLYNFDSDLSARLFEAILIIEVSVKSVINNVMTGSYGPHWYLNKDLFKNEFINTEEPSAYDKFLFELEKRCPVHDNVFIRNYYSRYTYPTLPPSWMMMEVISFGKITRIFKSLLPTSERVKIAHFFKTHDNILQSWLLTILSIRNQCAHHQKIIYRPLSIQPIMPKKKTNIFLLEHELVNPSKIYTVLCCIQYLLRSNNLHHKFAQNIINLTEAYPMINLNDLGFTPNWRQEPIWQ